MAHRVHGPVKSRNEHVYQHISRLWWLFNSPHTSTLRILVNMSSWWRDHMAIFSPLLALCEGNPPVTGGFPSQRPVTRVLMFSLMCAKTKGAHCDVILMTQFGNPLCFARVPTIKKFHYKDKTVSCRIFIIRTIYLDIPFYIKTGPWIFSSHVDGINRSHSCTLWPQQNK